MKIAWPMLLLALPASSLGAGYEVRRTTYAQVAWASEASSQAAVSRLEGEHELIGPSAFAVDPRGRLFVADQLAGRVQVFSPDGLHLTSLSGLSKHLDGLALGRGGALHLLVSGESPSCGTPYEIRVYGPDLRPARSVSLAVIHTLAKSPDSCRRLTALEVDAEERLHVLSQNPDETLTLDPSGKTAAAYPSENRWLCRGRAWMAEASTSKAWLTTSRGVALWRTPEDELYDDLLGCDNRRAYVSTVAKKAVRGHDHFLYRIDLAGKAQADKIPLGPKSGFRTGDFALGPARDCWIAPDGTLYCRGSYAADHFTVYKIEIVQK